MSIPVANPLPARSEVEALLLEHADVAEALLTDEEGPNGQSYPVAYVVPHAGRMQAAKARIYQADRDKRVAQWKKAFDQVYNSGAERHSPSFVGWTSSYTNKPIPEAEMREWLDCTVERIMSRRPERVLEIGCGVGLLVQKLAPRCPVYRGTDLSPVAVGRLREFVASKPELRHVELFEREAADLDEQETGSVDMVVINSVAQYFPDIHYLRTVLDAAARLVSPGGHIFIGDVRHLGLLPLFHGATQLAKAPPKASVRWLKRKIALAIAQDRELVIDPEFFLGLPASNHRISSVEILLKRGSSQNELTRYRYDVVLQVGQTRSTTLPQQALEWRADGRTAAELLSKFEAHQFASATISNIPNRRIAGDLAAMHRLWSADDRELVADVRQSVSSKDDPGLDPEEFWKVSEAKPYDVRVGWSPNSTDGHFDVTVVTRGNPSGAQVRQCEANAASARCQRALSTDPLEMAFMQQLGLELLQGLSDRLPASRLPAAVLAVKELPRDDTVEPHVQSRASRDEAMVGQAAQG